MLAAEITKTFHAVSSTITVKMHGTVAVNLTFLSMQIPPYQLKFNLAEPRKQLLETFLGRLLLQLL